MSQTHSFHQNRVHTVFKHRGAKDFRIKTGNASDSDFQYMKQVKVNKEGIYRIKSVLKEPDHGITESNWLTIGSEHYQSESSKAHYRVKGIGYNQISSPWAYSDMKTDEDELLAYHMISDILDALLTMDDENIQHAIDLVVQDVHQDVLQSGRPVQQLASEYEDSFKTKFNESSSYKKHQGFVDVSDSQIAQLKEISSFFKNQMKSNFKEHLRREAKEKVVAYRTYGFSEFYNEKTFDGFIKNLMMYFVEDLYDEEIKQRNEQVFTYRDDEFGYFLKEAFKEKIKKEILDHEFNLAFNDTFVTRLQDVVRVLQDPEITEQFNVKASSRHENEFYKALYDLIAGYATIDHLSATAMYEVEDEMKMRPESGVRELYTYSDDEFTKWALVRDIFNELIIETKDFQSNYEGFFREDLSNILLDKKIAMFLEFNMDEALEVALKIKEKSIVNLFKDKSKIIEKFKATIKEKVFFDKNKESDIKEILQSKLEEHIDSKQNNQIKKDESLESLIYEILNHEQNNEIINDETLEGNIKEESKSKEKRKEKGKEEIIESIFHESAASQEKNALIKKVYLKQASMKEMAEIMKRLDKIKNKEIMQTSLSDYYKDEKTLKKKKRRKTIKVLLDELIEKKESQAIDEKELKRVALGFILEFRENFKEINKEEEFTAEINDPFFWVYTVKRFFFDEIVETVIKGDYENLFIISPSEWLEKIIKEDYEKDLGMDLKDFYMIPQKEFVQYTVEGITSSWPLGHFELGRDRLTRNR